MRENWIEIKRGDIMPQYTGIYATMNPKGDIVISKVTYQLLGSPPAFNILYDRTNNRIGLKPATLTAKNAYPARVWNHAGAKMLRGHRLTREHRIELPHTIQFVGADIDEDGILILDLRTARHSPRAKDHPNRRSNGGGNDD
jgi:hypothetical protein